MHLPAPPSLEHLMTIDAQLASPLDGGEGPLGRRTLNAANGGNFVGARLKGNLNPGTGDWMLTAGETRVVDARLVLRCDDGAIIHMSYGGRIWFDPADLPALADPERRHKIDPTRYYFRTTPTFETGHPGYLWLNTVVAVGVGRLTAGPSVTYDIFAVS